MNAPKSPSLKFWPNVTFATLFHVATRVYVNPSPFGNLNAHVLLAFTDLPVKVKLTLVLVILVKTMVFAKFKKLDDLAVTVHLVLRVIDAKVISMIVLIINAKIMQLV